MAHPTTKERIEARVEIVTESGCWIWMDMLDKAGYARLSMWFKDRGHYVKRLAHRLSYEMFVGEIPDSLCVLHKCDMPACVNPDHLFVGTQAENLEDMRNKGRDRGASTTHREKTHCNAGHPLSGENLRIEGKIKARRCKKCESIKKARYYRERMRTSK